MHDLRPTVLQPAAFDVLLLLSNDIAKTRYLLVLGPGSHSEIWRTENGLLHNRRSVVRGTACLSP